VTRGPAPGLAGRLARAAALIAAITVLARVAGFGRTVVFGRTVGGGCVGAVYQTANTVPNIVFDIVAGGTLAALVVPLLAPAFVGQVRDVAAQTLSALLTWTVLVLTVVTVAIAGLAGVLVGALLGDGQCPGAADLGTRMLVVFAPQVLFYGIGVVLGGTLQAAERFAWPALSPLLSSGTVIVAYLLYGFLAGPGRTAQELTTRDELVLSVGTTIGVAVLAACLIPAVTRLGLRVRPTLRFPPGLAAPARRAALAGGATLGAQQVATGVLIWLANDGTTTGTVVVVTLAQTVFLLPWAVLAVPVATSAFPRLSGLWDAEERSGFVELTDRTARVVIAAAALGTAAFVAAAEPIAAVLLDPATTPAHAAFAPAIVAFTAGLLGWSLVALLSRALYAARDVATAAVAQVAGWGLVVAADLTLSALAPPSRRAVVLAIGNTLGVSLAAALLVLLARRRAVLAGVGTLLAHTARAAVAAAVGGAAGWSVGRAAAGRGVPAAIGLGVVAAVIGVAVAVGVLALIDRGLLERPAGRRPERPA
jgi:putative peptidoglycan lipid II flippase